MRKRKNMTTATNAKKIFTPKTEDDFRRILEDLIVSGANFIQIRTTEHERFLDILKDKMPFIPLNKGLVPMVNQLLQGYDPATDAVPEDLKSYCFAQKAWDIHIGFYDLRAGMYSYFDEETDQVTDSPFSASDEENEDENDYVYSDVNTESIAAAKNENYLAEIDKSPDQRESMDQLIQLLENKIQHSIVVIKDFDLFSKEPAFIRAFLNMNELFTRNDVCLIFLGDHLETLEHFKSYLTIVELPYPDEKVIRDILDDVCTQFEEENGIPTSYDDRSVYILKGLSVAEIYRALAHSLLNYREINNDVINEYKKQQIVKNKMLEIYDPVPIEELGGFDELKNYLIARKEAFLKGYPPIKGILLIGPPGVGKSMSAKVTASIFGVNLIRFDMSTMKSSLVGESESNLRTALKQIESIAPCVVWIDEIEKMLGGVMSSNQSDGGTTASMFGYLLSWMQENDKPIYIVATANDYQDLFRISQGALIRRFDDVFYLDFPNKKEREEVIKRKLKQFKVEGDPAYDVKKLVNLTENFTGAEIEKLIKASLFEGIDKALDNINPIYEQNKEVFAKLKEWAQANARIANSHVTKGKTIKSDPKTKQKIKQSLAKKRFKVA